MPNLHVAKKIAGTTFKISGGVPGKEVSWQVTCRRDDPYVREHGAPVEVEKPELERGFYQHPELYGQPEERGIDYRHRVHVEVRDRESASRPDAAAHGRHDEVPGEAGMIADHADPGAAQWPKRRSDEDATNQTRAS